MNIISMKAKKNKLKMINSMPKIIFIKVAFCNVFVSRLDTRMICNTEYHLEIYTVKMMFVPNQRLGIES